MGEWLLSKPRSTDEEPAPLGQGGQMRTAQFVVLAQPLLEPACAHFPEQSLIALPDQVRVEVWEVAHDPSPLFAAGPEKPYQYGDPGPIGAHQTSEVTLSDPCGREAKGPLAQ